MEKEDLIFLGKLFSENTYSMLQFGAETSHRCILGLL